MAVPKVLEQLPPEAANLVIQCLRKKHPTALLISKLKFAHETNPDEGMPSLDVSGPGLRLGGDRYGRLASIKGCRCLPDIDEFGGWMQRFFYDSETGEPIPGWISTPTPWLENWDTDLLEEIEVDEEMREQLRAIWD
jgi:hypothetical protein